MSVFCRRGPEHVCRWAREAVSRRPTAALRSGQVSGLTMVVRTDMGRCQAHRDTPGVEPVSRGGDCRGWAGEEVVCAGVVGLVPHP